MMFVLKMHSQHFSTLWAVRTVYEC